ncbi:MAG: sulfatase-like hydrolase/transferase [Flavobacteriales bacterium]|nr:sulfatase-like hydrolase/transferase [Flavobacteriales bacterium]
MEKKKKISDSLKKQNIVLIISDQQTWNPDYKKGFPDDSDQEVKNFPAMDKLLKNSVAFQNAHCNAATCTPSRTTLFTGSYPALHGAKQVLGFDYPFEEKGYTQIQQG